MLGSLERRWLSRDLVESAIRLTKNIKEIESNARSKVSFK